MQTNWERMVSRIQRNAKPFKSGQKKKKEFVKVRVKNTKLYSVNEIAKANSSLNFYNSRDWLSLRYMALIKHGRMCMCCHAQNVELHVDHIKPRSLHPELELDINNLQVLCRKCNLGKGNKDETDFRTR